MVEHNIETLSDRFLKPKSNTVVNIPVYQRGYDWEHDNIDDLWEDLLDHADGRYKDEKHFFGFIWSQEDSNFDERLPRYSIVDGQQRLVTCILLLIAIRDFSYNRECMQQIFHNICNVYLNYKCKNCNNRKTHYFRTIVDENNNTIQPEQNPDGTLNLYVVCPDCSNTMILKDELDNDGDSLDAVILKEVSVKGRIIIKKFAKYLKTKQIKSFIENGNEIPASFVNKHNFRTDPSKGCCDENPKKTIDTIQEILFTHDLTSNSPDMTQPVISLGIVNDSFFKDTLLPLMTTKEKSTKIKAQKNDLTDTNVKLANAYEYIITLLKEQYDEEGKEFYLKLLGKIDVLLKKFEYQHVPVDDENQAYQRFDTINNRGTGLNKQDLIKTRIFTFLHKNLGERLNQTLTQSQINAILKENEQKWADIRERITATSQSNYEFEKFLHHFIVVNYNYEVKKGEIFKQISDKLEAGLDTEELVKQFDEWSKVFVKIRDPKSTDWDGQNHPEIGWYLRTIRNYHSEICYHVIIASYFQHWEKNKKQTFAKIIGLSHRNFVRNKTIGQTPQNQIENCYKKIAHEIMTNENFDENSLQQAFLKDGSYILEDSVIEAQLNKPKNWYKRFSRLTQYLLEEVNNSIGTGYYPGPDIQIEHIMPENLTDEWKNYIKNQKSFSTDDEIKKYHEEFLHEIGNLTLLSKELNASIKDGLFDEKMGSTSSPDLCYARDAYKITSNLEHYTRWIDSDIIDRAKKLMKKILEVLDINNLDVPKGFDYSDLDPNGENRAADWYDRLQPF